MDTKLPGQRPQAVDPPPENPDPPPKTGFSTGLRKKKRSSKGKVPQPKTGPAGGKTK